MGRGVNAGVVIDKEPSPRRAAIEKAQAELRQEVAVREDRRRELEFLEKGGNPLDFTLSDTSAIGIHFLSPTDPLAEQIFTSEAKGRFGITALPNGKSGEDCGRVGSFLGRGSNPGGSLLILAGDVETLGSECSQMGQGPQVDGNQVDPHRISEDSNVGRIGMKNQAYARRNRSRSTNFNAHTSLRDTDKFGTVDGSSTVSTGMKGLVDVKEAEGDTLADRNRNISLISIAKAISLYRTGMPKTSSCKEHLGSDSDELHRQEGFQDLGKTNAEENCSFIKDDVKFEESQKQEYHAEDPVVTSRILEAAVATANVDNQILSLVDGSVAADKCKGTVEKEHDHNLNDGCSGGRNEGEKSSLVEPKDSNPSSHNTRDSVGNLIVSNANSAGVKDIHSIDESFNILRKSISDQTPGSANLDTKKEITATGSAHLYGCKRADSIPKEKSLVATDVKVKIEHTLPGKGVVMQAEGEMITGGHDVRVKDVSASTQEQKIDSQSGGINTSQKGAALSVVSVSSSFGSPSSKTSGVSIPLEKDTVVVEAERHRANLSAAAKKAHEDIILEEAEAKKAVLKRNAELARRRPFLEPPRRKSHWDFVLEEMAWMANDFMQERLWKMTAAAQLCRWVAQERGHPDFQVRELQLKQKRAAHMLSTAVMKFWQSVEEIICRDKHVANLQPQSSIASRTQKNRSDSEAVPMEIDPSITIEVHKKGPSADNMASSRHTPIQEYAIRFLTDTNGSSGLIQPSAASAAKRVLDSELSSVWEDNFPEESLFYLVPDGAMEAYRISMESDWASVQNREHTPAMVEIGAQVCSEGSDEARGLLEYRMSGFEDYPHGELSPKGRGLYGDEDDMRIQYLPGAFEGSKGAIFARKERKNIMKAYVPKNFDRRSSQAINHRFSVGNNAENDSVSPSPPVPGKRSSSNLNVGVIPTKRIRSSTVAARRPAGVPNAATLAASGIGNNTEASSGDTSSQQEAFSTSGFVSQLRKTTEVDSTGTCGSHLIYDATDTSFKFKKKKKSKPFGAVISSITRDAGGISGPPGKGSEPRYMWHQDTISQQEQREQAKWKGDSHNRICDTSLGALEAASEQQLSSSYGPIGQYASKKPKLSISKHLSDTSEVATPATNATLSPGASQLSTMSNANKLNRQIASRDRGRKNKTVKAASTSSHIGTGIPWSTIEDQALVVLVHDVGTNWELVSDIINSSLQLKGIFRKPIDCKERHKCLMERTAGDGCDSPEDSVSSQPFPATLHGVRKGSARLLLQRLRGPMEEDTLKIHFEKIMQVVQQHRSQEIQSDSKEQKHCTQVHSSHVVSISQKSSNSSSGGVLTPLDLCDETPSNSEILTNPYQLHAPHASGLAMANILGAASGIQPMSAGVTLLQGTNSVQLGTGLVASSVGLNVGAPARDVQRFASVRPLSASIDEQQHRSQQYNRMVAGRSLQQSAVTVSVGIPMIGLPNSNDCAVSLPTGGNGTGMMCALGRGMPLPRPGFPGIGSPGIPGMVSSGISNMLSSNGIGLPISGPVPSGTMHVPGSMIRRPRDMQMLQPSQEQRQMLMQELPLPASQNNGVNAAYSNQMVSSTNQNFSGQHQLQKPQQQQGHSNQYSQPQNQNHNQTYIQLARQLQQQQQHQQHQQQQNRYLQSQQQFPASSSLLSPLPQSQPYPLSHMQHGISSQPHVLSQEHQQQPVLSQHVLHQQTSSQQQSLSPSPPSLALQQCGASPINPALQSPQQQQLNPPQVPGQSLHVAGQSKSQPQNQIQKQQQQQAKVSKSLGREGILSQNTSPQPGQGNGLSSVPGNALPLQLQAQQAMHPVSGQRTLSGSGFLQLGKQMPQSAGKQGQFHGQGFSQQPLSKQQASQVVPQQQIPSASGTNHPPSSLQQLPLSTSEQQTSSVSTLLASSSQQQQRSVQPQQTSQRRLLQRQTGSNVGLQVSPHLGKESLQQQTLAISQPGNATFQTVSNVSCPSMVSTGPVVPLSSNLTSSTTTVQSSVWKAGQNIPQTSGGLYNLSRSNAASTSQILPSSSSLGTSMNSVNGNTAASMTTNTGLVSHGLEITGLSQQQCANPVGPVHEQKVGTIPAIATRAVQQMGAKNSPQQLQLQHQQQIISNDTQSAIANSPGSSHSRPATSGSLPLTMGTGAGIRSSYQGHTSSMPGLSASGPTPVYNTVQLRQVHAGHSYAQGSNSNSPISPSMPSLSSSDAAGTSSGLDSVPVITSVAAVSTPSTSSQQ